MSVDIGMLISNSTTHYNSFKNIAFQNGVALIAGTNTRVYRIVIWYQQGLTPEEIFQEYPHLTLAGVYAALAYYHANKEEIEAQIEAEDEFVETAIRLKP